jgi:2-oxoglutarate dehydrogenase E1 component
MYENYLANPGSVPDSWRQYFDALQHVPAVDGSNAKDVPHLPVVNAFAERAKQGGTRVVMASADAEMGRKRTAAQQLIAANWSMLCAKPTAAPWAPNTCTPPT